MIYPLHKQYIENDSVNQGRKNKNIEYYYYSKKYVIFRKSESIKCFVAFIYYLSLYFYLYVFL